MGKWETAVKKGFTLIELMIVLIIIGILATIGIVQYNKALEKARGSEAKQYIGHLRQRCAAIFYEEGIASCTNENLSMGSTGSEEIPTACRTSHFFSYAFSGASSGSEITFTATRCKSNGKNPQYPDSDTPTISLKVNYTGSGDSKFTVNPAGLY